MNIDEGPQGTRVTAAVGGLPPEGVASTFGKASDELGACFTENLKRVEFMGGDVKFFVKVDRKGKFMHAHLEHSDLGDRKTEQCLLDVLIAYRWPTPVGGDIGVATFSMGFDHSPDVEKPVPWDAERVRESIDEVADAIDECKSGLPGTFKATVYVKKTMWVPEPDEDEPDEDDADEGDDDDEPREIGQAHAASVTPPDEASEMAVDCLVDVLMKAVFPTPGISIAKARFEL